MKIPNLLSLSRIVLSPLVFVFFQIPGMEGRIITLVFLALLFLTDLFDGMLARTLNQTSDLGRILDPLADKVLVSVLFISLVFFRGLPVVLIIIVFIRDLFILLGGFYIRKTRNKIVESNIWGKLSTAILMLAVLFLIIEDFWYITIVLFGLGFICMTISSVTYLAVFYTMLKNEQKKIMRWAVFFCFLAAIGIVIGLQFVPARFSPGAYSREYYRELNGPEAEDIARLFSPVLWLAEGEQYYPLDVSVYLDHSKIMRQKKYIGLFETVVAVEPVTEEKMHSFNGSDFFLELDHEELSESRTAWMNYKTTVYSRVAQLNRGYIVQYWFFYLGSEAGDSGIYVHDADWEMIQVYLNDSKQPVAAGYSAHYYGETRTWDEVEKISGHPVVYVGRGGHGCFYSEGKHKAYLDNNRLFHAGYDTTGKGERLELDTGYSLSIITDLTWWAAYRGFWAHPGTTELEGPRYRNPRDIRRSMWQSPLAWMRSYYRGDKNW
ncbi:MAG: CDP-alcohol phosphatidyltransferase family protein [Spirochaetales bacterium]|nr:CDP-alcohol phosphatidyltransferase family protein [Spirochaetales bacterium]